MRQATVDILVRLFTKLRYRLLRIGPLVVGLCVCKIPLLRSYKLKLLSTWHDPGQRNSIDDFIYPGLFSAWIHSEYLSEKNPDTRESLKALAMGGTSGRNWAADYDSREFDLSGRIGNLSFNEADPLFGAIDEILIKNHGRRVCICQVGSSSGREIAYFAKKYPGYRFLGSDIYQDVVEYSSSHHKYPNLAFELFSATNICEKLLSIVNLDAVIVYASGSLQYVQPEHLALFFRQLAGVSGVEILLTEPGSESAGSPDKLGGSVWRGNFGYTHDYKYYAEQAGFLTAASKIIRPYYPYEDFPAHRGTIHYYYHGTRSNAAL